jgi:KDO2-lipid IV(A) lauroyltransferase
VTRLSAEASRDAVNRAVYRLGWNVAPRLPASALRRVAALGGRAAATRPGPFVRRWQRTIGLATGAFPDLRLTEQGLESYLRTFGEVLALPGWGPERIVDTVRTDAMGERRMRDAISDRGVVLALPHMANWDLAGAWACTTGLPVSTVAEQLADAEFRAFTRFREGLGMKVYAHRDPHVLRGLMTDARAGRLVCLVADRDLEGRGVAVTWPTPRGGYPVRVPAGPAVVARSTGALLMAIACHYTSDGMAISFSEPIEHRPGPAGLTAMVQEVTDYFAGAVVAHPADWHILQPFFDTARD